MVIETSSAFRVLAVQRWTEFNEYEGWIDIESPAHLGYPLRAYTLLSGDLQWAALGHEILGTLSLLRTSPQRSEPMPLHQLGPGLHLVAQATYDVIGFAQHVTGDQVLLRIAPNFDLRVDFDLPPGAECHFEVDELVELRGQLQIELE